MITAPARRSALRLVSSVEPSVVFASLAAQCVPDMSDACTVDVLDGTDARYRIAQPPRSESAGGLRRLADRAAVEPDHRVVIEFASPALDPSGTYDSERSTVTPDSWEYQGFQGFTGFPAFRGSVTFVWHRRAATSADRVMADLLVEHAVNTVGWQRHAQVTQAAVANVANLRIALQTSRQIGAAIGILMGRYKITAERAFELLGLASQQSHRKLRDVAIDVVTTGCLEPAPPRPRA